MTPEVGYGGADLVQEIYRALSRRPRAGFETSRKDLPTDGLYLFFEAGETLEIDGHVCDRVTRIGINNRDGNFRSRIRQHFGSLNSLSGSKNSSVFRKHVGGALMNQADPTDRRLAGWLAQGGPSYPEIEEDVSRYLRDRCTFTVLHIRDRLQRARAEAGLIALFAQHPVALPSVGWLGRSAANPDIRRTGLWNTRHVNGVPLLWDEFADLPWK